MPGDWRNCAVSPYLWGFSRCGRFLTPFVVLTMKPSVFELSPSILDQGLSRMAASNTPPDGGDTGADRGEISPEEREAFKRRADALGKKLEAAKSHSVTLPKSSSGGGNINGSAMAKALRISTELLGGLVVGTGLGWLIDKALGTWPAFFIVFFLLGAAAGMVNIVRAGASIKTGPANPNAGPSVPDDRDDEEDSRR